MKDFETHNFIKLLDTRKIEYHYEGKWLVVDGKVDERGDYDYVYLTYANLISLPDFIKFNNDGDVNLSHNYLTSLRDNIEFNNKGIVDLSNNKLASLSDNIKFNNRFIYLCVNPLESLPDNIDEFYDKLDIDTKVYIQKTFPDHWIVNKERFGL